MSDAVNQELDILIRSRYPLIYILSSEECRVEQALREIAAGRDKSLLTWTVTRGVEGAPGDPDRQARSPLAALEKAASHAGPAVFLFKDLHPFLSQPEVTRALRDLARSLRSSQKTVILLSPVLAVPPELEHQVMIVEYPLPSARDLDRLLETVAASMSAIPKVNTGLTAEERRQVIEALAGLTAEQAEGLLCRSVVETLRFDPALIRTRARLLPPAGTRIAGTAAAAEPAADAPVADAAS